MRPVMLDLFCGAGGAGVGYQWAGWHVVGNDILPHDAPFPVLVGDAFELLRDRRFLSRFDAVHTSPPCQPVTTMSAKHRGKGTRADQHVNHIPDVLRLLEEWGGPYVMENVPGARRYIPGAITLSGGMFGLGVERPRLFASNIPLTRPTYRRATSPVGVYGREPDGRRLWTRRDGSVLRAARGLEEGQAAMGIDWMSWSDLTEAIPPAYTEHIGRQLLAHVGQVAA